MIKRHPETIPSLTRPLLQHVPECVVPELLKRGIGDERPLNSHPDHSLRLLHDWAISGEPGTDQPVARRRALWESLKRWLADGGDQRIALRALRSVVSPAFEDTDQDPGEPRSYWLRRGAVTAADAKEIAGIWREILQCLNGMTITDWGPVVEAL